MPDDNDSLSVFNPKRMYVEHVASTDHDTGNGDFGPSYSGSGLNNVSPHMDRLPPDTFDEEHAELNYTRPEPVRVVSVTDALAPELTTINIPLAVGTMSAMLFGKNYLAVRRYIWASAVGGFFASDPSALVAGTGIPIPLNPMIIYAFAELYVSNPLPGAVSVYGLEYSR